MPCRRRSSHCRSARCQPLRRYSKRPPVRPWIACDPRGFNSPEARTQAELCMMAGASSPPLVHTSKSAPFMRAGSWVREPREHTCGCCSSCCSCCSCCSCYSCCSCCSCGSCCCSAARSAQGNQAGVGLGASLRRWPKRRALLPVSRGRALVLKSRVTDGGRARATRRPSMALGCNPTILSDKGEPYATRSIISK